jgi:hypothetical protein
MWARQRAVRSANQSERRSRARGKSRREPLPPIPADPGLPAAMPWNGLGQPANEAGGGGALARVQAQLHTTVPINSTLTAPTPVRFTSPEESEGAYVPFKGLSTRSGEPAPATPRPRAHTEAGTRDVRTSLEHQVRLRVTPGSRHLGRCRHTTHRRRGRRSACRPTHPCSRPAGAASRTRTVDISRRKALVPSSGTRLRRTAVILPTGTRRRLAWRRMAFTRRRTMSDVRRAPCCVVRAGIVARRPHARSAAAAAVRLSLPRARA